MSKHPASTAGDLISPKILAQLRVTLGLTPLAALLAALTPDAAGAWSLRRARGYRRGGR